MIVLVHGVPETGAIWDDLRECLDADAVALWLPGFGCARPDGFGATMDDYATWLVGELEGFDEPIDLVGHDWGAMLTYRIATTHGRLLRSWVADIAGGLHPDYVWHDIAQVWQTPGAGEELIAQSIATDPDDMAAVFLSYGVPEQGARKLASWMDETMGSCILPLYRSATPNVASHWMDVWGTTSAPGLVLQPTEDPFGNAPLSEQVAALLGARYEQLEGIGHWWPLEAPGAAAPLIEAFWDSLG